MNLCRPNVWAEHADYKQRWKTHWVLICSNIRLYTWPRAQLDQWRCLKGGCTCFIALPATASPSLSFLSYSFYVTLISPSYHELKKASCKHSSQMTWKEARSHTKACLWPFWDVLLVACFVASDWLHASTNAIRHWKSFQITGHDRLSLGSFCCPGVTLIPSHTSMWNWGHMARASVLGLGGILDCGL